MNIYLDAPFLFVNIYGIKLSIIFFGLFIMMFAIFIGCGIKNGMYSIDWKKSFQNNKKQIALCLISYGIICAAYFYKDLITNDGNVLLELAKTYLEYEILIMAILCLLLMYACLIKHNKDNWLSLLKNIAAIIILISLTTTSITNQVAIFSKSNIIMFGCLLLIAAALLILKVVPLDTNEKNAPIFHATKTYDALFPIRQKQAQALINYITNLDQGAASICISGKWGYGKTSLINGALEKLSTDSDRKYNIITINALEIDTAQYLFKYIFSQIKHVLHEYGVYVGINSDYHDFIASSTGVVVNSGFSSLISKALSFKDRDYRQQKNTLENLLARALGQDKIIVVVDDLERCTKEKTKEFLFIIKEIATMKNCISIFAVDYDKLVDSDQENNKDFFEKFFNYRVEVVDTSIYAIRVHCEKNLKMDAYSNLNLPYFYCAELIADKEKAYSELSKVKLSTNKDEEKKEQQAKDVYNTLLSICNDFKNPRKMIKLYDIYSSYCNLINLALTNTKWDKNSLTSYFEKINLSKILFSLAYINVFNFDDYISIQSDADDYIYNLNGNISQDRYTSRNIQLLDGLLFDVMTISNVCYLNISYSQHDAIKFVKYLLGSNTQELPNLINGFASIEQEWFSALEKDTLDFLESQWQPVLSTILKHDNQSLKPCKLNQYIGKLFNYAHSKMISKDWDINYIFELLKKSMQNIREINTQMNFFSTFNKHFIENTDSAKFILQLQDQNKIFATNFPFHNTEVYTRFLNFLTNDNEKFKSKIEEIRAETYHITNKPEDVIIAFINNLISLDPFNGLNIEMEQSIACLDQFYELAESYFKENGLGEYKEIQHYLAKLQATNSEIKSYVQLCTALNTSKSYYSLNMPELQVGNIDDLISYFEHIFKLPEHYKVETWEDFLSVFRLIQEMNVLDLSSEQINKLHQLITTYSFLSKDYRPFCREVLAAYCYENNIDHSL